MGIRVQDKLGYVFGFLFLVFALSTPFWVLGIIYRVDLLPGLPIGALVAFTPGLAAVLMAYGSGHLPAVRRLMRRLFDFNRINDKKWYFIFVFFNPVVATLAYGGMRAMGTALPKSSPLTLTVVPMFASFFIAALGEEIGWTGYATEPFLRRWGVLRTGVLLGLAWAVFHFVVLTQADRSLGWIAWWSLGTLSLRTILVWLYDHAGKSVFAAAVFHSMINLSWQLFPVNGSFYDPRIFSLITFGLAFLIISTQRLMSRARIGNNTEP